MPWAVLCVLRTTSRREEHDLVLELTRPDAVSGRVARATVDTTGTARPTRRIANRHSSEWLSSVLESVRGDHWQQLTRRLDFSRDFVEVFSLECRHLTRGWPWRLALEQC